jgi:hypothetical protein
MDYFQNATAYNLLGVRQAPASAGSPAGEQLPRVTVGSGDSIAVPWHPDSPHFWFLALGVLAIVGVVGASVDVRAGKRHARASVND